MSTIYGTNVQNVEYSLDFTTWNGLLVVHCDCIYFCWFLSISLMHIVFFYYFLLYSLSNPKSQTLYSFILIGSVHAVSQLKHNSIKHTSIKDHLKRFALATCLMMRSLHIQESQISEKMYNTCSKNFSILKKVRDSSNNLHVLYD
jgi:hypothetical protein